MDKKVLKAKVKTVLLKHLKEKGYPNLSGKQILEELPEMWMKLDKAGLIVAGMSFKAFVTHACHQYDLAMMAEMKTRMSDEFNRIFRKGRR